MYREKSKLNDKLIREKKIKKHLPVFEKMISQLKQQPTTPPSSSYSDTGVWTKSPIKTDQEKDSYEETKRNLDKEYSKRLRISKQKTPVRKEYYQNLLDTYGVKYNTKETIPVLQAKIKEYEEISKSIK
jgi:hypothetical protein